jgi:hypothetical protein
MAKLAMAVLAFLSVTRCAPITANAYPRQTAQGRKNSQMIDIKGTVRSDDGKITFVADDGGNSWDVTNPDTLVNSVDQHLKVTADVYADKNQIHIIKVVKI